MTERAVLDLYRPDLDAPRAHHSPDQEVLRRWATDNGMTAASVGELTRDPRVRRLFQEVVDATNANLARHEQIRSFAMLPLPLSVAGGHLTPTLKVKRRVVEKEYAKLVESLYPE